VKKRPATNISASVHQRLLNRARESGQSFNSLLQHFAMERFLYRLSRSEYADRFVLKGALMLTVWRIAQSRPTLDIDLLGRGSNSPDEMVAVTRAVCQQEGEPDGMSFDADTVVGARIVEEAEYEGVRLRFRGSLGNAVVSMQIDVGFGDVVVPAAQVVEYPTLLDFPAPRLRGYSKESTIAEKLHALGSRGLLTSRMKDFFDLWLLSRQFDFDGATLAEAIQVAFARRATPLDQTPEVLTAAFAQDEVKVAQWRAFRRRVEAPESLAEVVAHLAGFLGPIAEALSAGRPFQGTWRAPGPWLAR
jgi:predicted nucleotidyltransferase component of viral defense system